MTFRPLVLMTALLCLGLAASASAQQQDPAAVAAAWGRVSDAPAELTEVRSLTLALRDARIADAALAAVGNSARPTEVRLAALQALVSYVDPELSVEMATLRQPGPTDGLAEVIHSSATEGSQAPSADLPRRIGETIWALGENDPDPVIRDAATFLTRELVQTHPEAVILPAGSVTVANPCGAKYRITNHTRIDLSVRLVTPSDVYKNSLRIPAKGTREVATTEGGPARLLVGGAELARSGSGGSCR